MTGLPIASIYRGEVMHHRLRPRAHKFSYRTFSFLLDIDALTELANNHAWFGYNAPAPYSFYDADHGPRDGSPLRPWVEAAGQRAGIDLAGGRILILCLPRLFGYVFNPISIYFCHDRQGALAAILYEVKNTFGEQHGYLLPIHEIREDKMLCHEHQKDFFVSPFIGMEAMYQFRLRVPDARLQFLIRQADAEGPLLLATHTGKHEAFSDKNLRRLFWRYPLLTFKVMAGIHFEALRLWLKGIKLVEKPMPPSEEIT